MTEGGSALDAADVLPRGHDMRSDPPLPRSLERLASWCSGWAAGRVIVASLRVFLRARGLSRSAEISYWSILSIIPLGALLLTMAAQVAVVFVGSQWTPETLAAEAGAFIYGILPAARPDVERAVLGLLETRGALGIVGTVALVLTSSIVFGAVSRALTDIFQVPARGRLKSIALFSIFLVAVVTVYLVGMPVFNALSWALQSVEFPQDSLHRGWVHLGGSVVTGLTFVFFVVYVVRVPVRWPLVQGGAVCFVASADLVRIGLRAYMAHLGQMNLVYGSLAGLMAVLLWAFYVAVSLLWIMSMVRVLQERLHHGPLGFRAWGSVPIGDDKQGG